MNELVMISTATCAKNLGLLRPNKTDRFLRTEMEQFGILIRPVCERLLPGLHRVGRYQKPVVEINT
jgi:hypothetical protein